MYILETQRLGFHFRSGQRALDDINLHVETGSIYGFLGPNGAGKTTTLKLILGLLKVQEGSIRMFGEYFHKDRIAILQKTGALIESPSFYSHLTAKENLQVLQKVYKCTTARIHEVLKLVGLSDTGNKKAGQFSLGMKQRLGIAVSLLHNPSLLILDEPTNGLDPNGMIEIRSMLTELNKQAGITVLISSHILAELEKLVTHVGVINKGKLMYEGSLHALRNQEATESTFIIETSDIEKTIAILKAKHIALEIQGSKILTKALSKQRMAQINRQLVLNDVEVYELTTVKTDLESIFMQLVNKEQ